jgi:hypothetical protein
MDKKILQAFAPLPDTFDDVVTISHEHKDRVNPAFVRYVSELDAMSDDLTAAKHCIAELAGALQSIHDYGYVNMADHDTVANLLTTHAEMIEKAKNA